ncbi:phage tail protein [Paludibacterium paludis]|uniref:Tail protein n=1 Tax=Paludibacterium paludis TaxID=1225769 RepID=A0A918NY81_9NEIS|nr:phage tail protein [Paludibacterium paludis]GGY03814.1 tail protein [Paludibacterium paludis]
MQKPASLRAALEAALPSLRGNPDRMLMFIESGKIAAGMGKPSFEYRYTVSIVLMDFAEHPDTVMIPILQWLRVNQPSVLQSGENSAKAIQFEAEILNHETIDLHLKVELSECVKVDVQNGTATATHLPEPQLATTLPIGAVQVA